MHKTIFTSKPAFSHFEQTCKCRKRSKGTVTISIDKDGTISFSTSPSNNRTVTDAELVTLLEQVKAVDRDIPVLIKADETTQLKKLAFVMDACRKTGLNKFSLQSR